MRDGSVAGRRSTTPRAARWTDRLPSPPVERPYAIMGVVNVTPDSFSDGGAFEDDISAIAHARRLVSEGASIVDIGGESTRPGAEPVTVAAELARVLPVVQ